jgi:uncharacterized membrane protein YdjX (TVP38/TMEM64 family)
MKSLRSYWRQYRSSRGLSRELTTIGLCLVVGLLLVPGAIFVVGQSLLGAYAHGGFGSFVADIVGQLLTGSVLFWLLVLGPYGAVWLWRGWRQLRQ